MSHGVKSAAAVLLALGALLTAGIANADCGPTHSAQVTQPAPGEPSAPARPATDARG